MRHDITRLRSTNARPGVFRTHTRTSKPVSGGGEVMDMNSSEWLLSKGGFDDCYITSVGGAAFALFRDEAERSEFDWRKFPIKEMIKRKWVTSGAAIGSEFFGRINGWDRICPLFRRTRIRS